MIELQINGKRVELEAPTPLLDYLRALGVDARAVAVEHNGEIVDRAHFEAVVLKEGDQVEIVRMVGGGSPGARLEGSPRTLAFVGYRAHF